MLSTTDIFRLVYAAGVAHTTVKRVYHGGRPATRRTFDKLTAAALTLNLPPPPERGLKRPPTHADWLERQRRSRLK